MWNAEGWSRCALSFFKIDRIHHFDIRHTLFDIRFFKVSFRLNWPLLRPVAALNPEPLNPQTDILTDILEFTTFAE